MSEIPGSAMADWIRRNPKKGAVSGNAYTGVVDKSKFGDGSQGRGVSGKWWKNGELQDPNASPFDGITINDILEDPLFVPTAFSLGAFLFVYGVALNEQALNIVLEKAGQVVTGFTPGAITTIGDV